jgi:hypothetical protein
MAIVASGHRGFSGLAGTRRRLGASSAWRRYREVVERRDGNGRFTILLKEIGGPVPAGLGALTPQEGGLLSTAGAVGTTTAVSSLAAGTALGSWAGPIGAGVGALVGVIAGLFAASAARAKGAKTENEAINEYLPSWDAGMQQIFAAANAGAPVSECISAVESLMSNWWQAAAQFRGLPGVADASGGGVNCGTYVSGQTTPCSPTGGPNCNKSCTAFCCVGCRDLMPSAQDAIAAFGNPHGGTISVCTVYGSSYGATQRNQYSLTFTPPPPTAAVSATGATASSPAVAATSGLVATNTTGTMTILGVPWYLLAGGGVAAWLALR